MASGKLSRRTAALALAVALTTTSALVLADDDPPAAPPAGDPAAAPADVDVPMQTQAELSPEDMLTHADELLANMRDVLTRIVRLRKVAQKQKDVIKLNCLNDKLLQVKQLLNIAEEARTALDEAIAAQDEGGRYGHHNSIVIANEEVMARGAEAENCIGEELVFLGPTEVTAEEPEEPDDPTEPDNPTPPVVEPPPVASPFI